MKKELLATAWGQIVGIALLMGVPVGIAFYMLVVNAPPRALEKGWSPGMVIVMITVLLVLTVLFALIFRRSVELSDEALLVRHSYYSITIARKDVTAIEATELKSVAELGLTLKTNGVAAFGYLSGWFRTRTGAPIFCAVSAKPIYLVSLTGARLACPTLALSCSADMAEKIRRWVQ